MDRITYKVTGEPGVEPLELADLKSRLRVTTSDFDTEITDLLKAGRRQVEHDSHRKLINQTVQMSLDRFPTGSELEIRLAPVSVITSVGYTDSDGDSQTFASSNYTADLTSTPPRLQLADGVFWPATDNIPNAVVVTFTAGYGASADDVPVEARLAVAEWCLMHWADCDGDKRKYDNLINRLAWSGHWIPAEVT